MPLTWFKLVFIHIITWWTLVVTALLPHSQFPHVWRHGLLSNLRKLAMPPKCVMWQCYLYASFVNDKSAGLQLWSQHLSVCLLLSLLFSSHIEMVGGSHLDCTHYIQLTIQGNWRVGEGLSQLMFIMCYDMTAHKLESCELHFIVLI